MMRWTHKPDAVSRMFAMLMFMAIASASRADALPPTSKTQRGPVMAELTIEPTDVQVGAAVELRLRVSAPDGVEVLMPEFGEFLGQYSILDFAPNTTVAADGETTYTQRYELQVLRSGRQRLAPILIEFVDRRNASGDPETVFELLTDAVGFTVRAISAEALDTPLAPPLTALPPRSFPEREPVLTGVIVTLVLLLVAGVLLWAWRRRAAIVAVEAAHDVALARLRNLRAQPRQNHDDVDAFYVELSSLVRDYVEARFGLHAPELTTEEFLIAARDADQLAPLDREFLGDLLTESDQVKFAGFVPEKAKVNNTLDAVAQFLARTGDASQTSDSPSVATRIDAKTNTETGAQHA